MRIEFSRGILIVTPHEILIRLTDMPDTVLQAQQESITLFGQEANVIMANGGGVKWSIKVDNTDQLKWISEELGCEIR
ncbi:DUF3389 family protein [Vibrio palustris]|uniref:DUF3389 domain-containing protein n=1 Tax=Vibrio palustris TaxID=1918946 RepID=A0A1R4B4N8_9VIBR|nr:DUF3389 family protein [Vibrio palustris]SJL83869.1 hypothetical protein VPAL9027_01848 [Vibrio palustris]